MSAVRVKQPAGHDCSAIAAFSDAACPGGLGSIHPDEPSEQRTPAGARFFLRPSRSPAPRCLEWDLPRAPRPRAVYPAVSARRMLLLFRPPVGRPGRKALQALLSKSRPDLRGHNGSQGRLVFPDSVERRLRVQRGSAFGGQCLQRGADRLVPQCPVAGRVRRTAWGLTRTGRCGLCPPV